MSSEHTVRIDSVAGSKRALRFITQRRITDADQQNHSA
jgi:hypothetical protein